MTKLPFALSTAFLLSACSADISKQVIRECDGPAGHAEIIKNRFGDNKLTLVSDMKDGTHHEYSISISAPNDGGEFIVGENAVPKTCATGKPDTRWKEMTP